VYREHLNVHQTFDKIGQPAEGTERRWHSGLVDLTGRRPSTQSVRARHLKKKSLRVSCQHLDKVVFGCCVSVIALALIALAFNAYKKRQSAAAADASAPRSAARPSSYRVLV